MSPAEAPCADCKTPVHLPTNHKASEYRVCVDCFARRWVEKGRPSDPSTGEIVLFESDKRVRWSTPVRN